jgi:hypothetical protein
MKVLIGAASALLLTAVSALAQTPTPPAVAATTPAPPPPPSRCGAAPEPPTVPDVATATPESMQSALAGYETWRIATQANIDCRRAEALEARAIVDARVAEFNSANSQAHDTGVAFQAAADAFAAAHPQRRRLSR